MPHTVVTSPTQMPSQKVVVQYGSTALMLSTQLAGAGGTSQPETSAAPVEHRVWLQVPGEAGEIRLFVALFTSLRHVSSPEVGVLNGSAAPMLAI